MKTFRNLLMAVAILFMTSAAFAQGTLTGTVTDGDLGLPLPGASVMVKGTSNGTATDFDGKFSINVSQSSGILVISYIGFVKKEVPFNIAETSLDLGTISLSPDANELEGVVLVGVVDLAKDRKTPVAVSTIKASDIVERLGNLELPELLNATPSVYATKSGGGFGDSRINIRGFDQVNTAVLINGVPVNDMENGSVFWSNWTGLSDVASAIQVQRGLGSSKLAISSVGGTLNIVTKTTDRQEGGFVGTTLGNDNYLKTIMSYSTGRMENGLAVTALFSRTAGDGYVDGTAFEGYNYFLGFGWSDDANKHSVQFTATGAPQVHNQRTTSFFNMATLENYLTFGKKYNYNHGFLDGKEFNWRQNFYHKPVTSINWDWNINDRSKLSTVVYASFGRGGGTGDIGRLNGRFASDPIFRDANGLVRWNAIENSNGGSATLFEDFGGTGSDSFVYQNQVDPITGTFIVNDDSLRDGPVADPAANELPGVVRRNGAIRRASINSHNWYGLLANFNTEINESLVMDFGVDLRSYKGFHYRRVDNLLGSDGYRDNDNINDPFNVVTNAGVVTSDFRSIVNVFKSIDDDEKIDYYNTGLVRWAGVFGQLEYSKDAISAFVQFGASNQGFKREDFFTYLDSDPLQITDWENILGGNIKGGLNWNVDEQNNLFFNAGYYSKQPLFDAVFLNFANIVNDDLRNEKILGTEIGYGFQTGTFRANLNLYRTSWKDRFISVDKTFDTDGDGLGDDNTNFDGPTDTDGEADDVQGTANISGVEQVHMGVELETSYRPTDFLTINAMVSVGDWKYKGNPSGNAFDDGQNLLGQTELVLDDIKVGDAAQTTSRLAVIVEPVERLRFDVAWFRADNLYGNFNADEFADTTDDGVTQADNDGFQLQLPAYNLFDGGLSYRMLLGKEKTNSLNFRLNVNNLFNTEYLVESATNIETATDPADNFDGVNTRNKVFFGFGRTWNFSLRYNF